MKTLTRFVLLVFVSVLAIPSTWAASNTLTDDETLSEQNIEDYYEFDDDTWWEYEITSASYGSEQIKRTVEIDNDGTGLTGYFEDNIYYLDGYDGEDFDEPYIGADFASYSQEIQEDAYLAFGIDENDWGQVGNVNTSCEYTLEPNESVEMDNGETYENTGILGECSLEFEILEGADGLSSLTGSTIEFIVESHYIKGLGLVSFTASSGVDGAFLGRVSSELISTSLLEDATFTDVEVENKNFPAIDYLYDEGVLAGYGDGTFKPDNTVNRAELLKILVEGQGVTPDENTYKNCFPDVTTDWYAKYVCYAKEKGWVGGYPDGTFRPSDSVNKVEALKMLLNSQDIDTETPEEKPFTDVSTSDWFAPYVATAQSLELLEETGYSFSPDSDRSRAGIAEELYRLLTSL